MCGENKFLNYFLIFTLRYIELAEGFAKNSVAFKLATSFVLLRNLRAMSKNAFSEY